MPFEDKQRALAKQMEHASMNKLNGRIYKQISVNLSP